MAYFFVPTSYHCYTNFGDVPNIYTGSMCDRWGDFAAVLRLNQGPVFSGLVRDRCMNSSALRNLEESPDISRRAVRPFRVLRAISVSEQGPRIFEAMLRDR